MPNPKQTRKPQGQNGGNRDRRHKKSFNKSGNQSSQPRKRKLEITFDLESRNKYITGLSARKKERRAFGLAMQKVKDRKAKIEQRKEDRRIQMEKILEAEKQKKSMMGSYSSDDDDDEADTTSEGGSANAQHEDEDCDKSSDHNVDDVSAVVGRIVGTSGSSASLMKEKKKKKSNSNKTTTKTFQDELTQSTFGGNVTVTTTFGLPSDDEDDDDKNMKQGRKEKGVDEQQRYAGNVKKYLGQMKGLTKKKKSQGSGKSMKGKHGAEGMKGMGSAKDLKVAQKALGKVRATGKGQPATGRGKNKRRK